MRTFCLIMACASFTWAASTTKRTETKPSRAEHVAVQQRWPAQELKGTVSMVDPQRDLLVVRDASGVPFDFQIERSTHILSGRQAVKLSDLAKNQSVDVRFIPEARGDMARQIEVQRRVLLRSPKGVGSAADRSFSSPVETIRG